MAALQLFARQASCVAIEGRGVLIEGEPGTGKSSLLLELIDRGAELVGDDGVLLNVANGRLLAHPHPEIRGLVEVRNLGLLRFPCREETPVALAIALDPAASRYIEGPECLEVAGVALPLVRIWPQEYPPTLKVELALQHFGLHF